MSVVLALIVAISIHALREEGDETCRICQIMEYNFYPRPPRGGRPAERNPNTNVKNISIHALREEGDTRTWTEMVDGIQFLSTPSARRATRWPSGPPAGRWNFYPRPPRGGRPRRSAAGGAVCGFLSTPSARRATWLASVDMPVGEFLSTPSARRATNAGCVIRTDFVISIHALREEGDEQHYIRPETILHFYPRPPRGGRHRITRLPN